VFFTRKAVECDRDKFHIPYSIIALENVATIMVEGWVNTIIV
jgi:hypothetical protein